MRSALLSALLAASGCLDLPDVQYETEQAIIGTDYSVRLCPGDLDGIDRHIEFVEDMLGAASDEKLEIYLYSDSVPRCGGHGYSCYDSRRKMIRAHWTDLEHEIVHAVVDRFAEPPPFWNEGIAVALDGNGTHVGGATVSASIHVDDAVDLDYSTAGHFVRWLLEEHDPMLIRPILEGANFESTYQIPFPEETSRFEADKPYAYPPWFTCEHPMLQQQQDGAWSESVETGCDAEGGSTAYGGPYSVVRTVDLEVGRYELAVRGGLGARLLGCQTEVFQEEPAPPPAMVHGDVPNQVESGQTHPGVLFESGDQVHRIEITVPGSFEVVMMTRQEGETVDLELRRVE